MELSVAATSELSDGSVIRSAGPVLLFIVGPPAVGKMTVGHEIATRTGLRLFHNHLSIESVLRFFDFGSPPFGRLVEGFRTHVCEEVAASDLPGLIFTFVWAYNTHLAPAAAADIAIDHFGLPRC